MNQITSWLYPNQFDLTTVMSTFALLIGASVVIVVLSRLLKKWLSAAESRIGLRTESIGTIVRLIASVLWIVTLLLILDIWGIGVGGIWTVLVSVATVIGVGFLATWAMISNITASLLLAIWRPFRLGDNVELLPENLKGRAIDRNLMFTVLREDSGALLQVPNNLFFQKMFRVHGGS